jgi:hypothetical protein
MYLEAMEDWVNAYYTYTNDLKASNAAVTAAARQKYDQRTLGVRERNRQKMSVVEER